MRFSPMLALCSGVLGLLSGAAALPLRKGSRSHGVAGSVFVIAMLSLAASGVYLAVVKSEPGNVLGGVLTFYLVAMAWVTARRRSEEIGMSALGTVALTWELEAANSPTGVKHEYPPGPYFFLGSVAVAAVIGDVRILVRHGISGARRIARHLWRMCFALFIASASVFLARQHLFPTLLRKTGTLFLPSVLPLLAMIFWLVRVLFTKAHRQKMLVANLPAEATIQPR